MTEEQLRTLAAILPPEWINLIRLGASIKFGEARIVFQEGKPQRADLAVKQIKLDKFADPFDELKTLRL